MDAGLLDTLVKLASLGASGICIFAIFWVGWLIHHLPEKANAQRHQTLRTFMVMNVVIAVIAAVTGIANAWFNANTIAKVEKEKVDAVETVEKQKEAAVLSVEAEKERIQAAKASLERDFELYKQENQQRLVHYKNQQIRNQEIAANLQELLNVKEIAALETSAEPRINDQIKSLKSNIERLKGTTLPD